MFVTCLNNATGGIWASGQFYVQAYPITSRIIRVTHYEARPSLFALDELMTHIFSDLCFGSVKAHELSNLQFAPKTNLEQKVQSIQDKLQNEEVGTKHETEKHGEDTGIRVNFVVRGAYT